MENLKKYLNSLEFFSLGLCGEFELVSSINPKLLKHIRLYDNPIYIEIKDLELVSFNKNEIFDYPKKIIFLDKKGSSVKIPIFVRNVDMLTVILNNFSKSYKVIKIEDVEKQMNENEKLYFYQTKFMLYRLFNK